jgi:hypothetical protein
MSFFVYLRILPFPRMSFSFIEGFLQFAMNGSLVYLRIAQFPRMSFFVYLRISPVCYEGFSRLFKDSLVF